MSSLSGYDRLKLKNEALQKEFDDLQESNTKLQQSYNQLKSEKEKLHEGDGKLQQSYNELKAKKEKLQAEYKEANDAFQKLLGKSAELQEENKTLQTAFEKLKADGMKPNSIKKVLQKMGSFLISPELGFLTLIFVLLVQVQHNSSIFYRSDYSPNWVTAIVYAIGVDLFALILAIHFNSEKTLKVFAVFQFILNILYYSVWLKHDSLSPQFAWELMTTTCISGLLSFAIYSYGELFVKIVSIHIKNTTQ